MIYNNKNVIQVVFIPVAEGLTVEPQEQNIAILFDDNSVQTIRYSTILRNVNNYNAQSPDSIIAKQLAVYIDLKTLCDSTLGFSE